MINVQENNSESCSPEEVQQPPASTPDLVTGVSADPYQLHGAQIIDQHRPMHNGEIIRDSNEIAELLT